MIRLIVLLQERYIGFLVLLVFLLLCVIQIKLPVLPGWEDTSIVAVLSSSAFENIASSILASIVAAYMFYLFINVIPQNKALAETHFSLDNILAAIALSFVNKSRPHLRSDIDRQNIKILELSKLSEIVEEARTGASYESVLSTTLHVNDIGHVLDQGTIMASSISSKHAMFWIQICSRSRELTGMLEQIPRHDVFVPSDVFRDDPDDYGQAESFRLYSNHMHHFRDRLRVKCWLLLDDILFWKKNYSVAKPAKTKRS